MKKNRVAGILPTSLNDYPSEISSVIFFQGCNLSCSYCYNKELIPIKEGNYSLEYVLEFIKKRKDFITAVVFSGGEPLLHLDVLPDFTKEIKNINSKLKIKIDTNGILIKELDKLIEKDEIIVDKIAIDIKGTEEIYKKFSFNIDINIYDIFNFAEKYKDKVILRTTIFEDLLDIKKEFINFLIKNIPEKINYYFQRERKINYLKKEEKNNKYEYFKEDVIYLKDIKKLNILYEYEKIN